MKRVIPLLLLTLIFCSCKKNENMKVKLETTEGDIVIQLYDDTPKHRDNFVKLVKDGYYNGIIFHRVIDGFMIQAGDPDSKNPTPDGQYGSGGPGYTIEAEFLPNRHHKKGALAAARSGDHVNPNKESSGSQFYIVQGDVYHEDDFKGSTRFSEDAIKDYTTIGGTPHLDGGYTVFGEVIEGLDIVDKIAGTPTRPGDRPVKDIVITKATIVK